YLLDLAAPDHPAGDEKAADAGASGHPRQRRPAEGERGGGHHQGGRAADGEIADHPRRVDAVVGALRSWWGLAHGTSPAGGRPFPVTSRPPDHGNHNRAGIRRPFPLAAVQTTGPATPRAPGAGAWPIPPPGHDPFVQLRRAACTRRWRLTPPPGR